MARFMQKICSAFVGVSAVTILLGAGFGLSMPALLMPTDDAEAVNEIVLDPFPVELPTLDLSGQAAVYPVLRITSPGVLVLDVDGTETEIAIEGVQASVMPGDPKLAHPYNDDAVQAMRLMIGGEFVRVVPPLADAKTDAHKRPVVAVLREPDGLHVGFEVIRSGFARADRQRPHAYRDVLVTAERRARAMDRGVWNRDLLERMAAARIAALKERHDARKDSTDSDSETVTVYPDEDPSQPHNEKPQQTRKGTVFVTANGSKYHLPTCRFVNGYAKEMSVTEAEREGKAPCKVCKPNHEKKD